VIIGLFGELFFMTDYQGIKQIVKKLENDAHDIQNLLEEFFSTATIDEKYGLFYWETPEGDLELLHQQLILIYESWYNQSHMLIQSYYPKKELEFRGLHDNKEEIDDRPMFKGSKQIKYGISDTIQLKAYIRSGDSKETTIKDIIGAFRKQLAILIALPEVLHLCRQGSISEEIDQTSKKIDSSVIPSQTFNITTGSQYIDNSTHIIQNFSNASEFVERNVQNGKMKQDLLRELKEFETTKSPKEYMLKYQNFVAMLANHVTVFSPVLTFLLEHLPK
jgi:hypothetical protein